jgi:hypothetical protein
VPVTLSGNVGSPLRVHNLPDHAAEVYYTHQKHPGRRQTVARRADQWSERLASTIPVQGAGRPDGSSQPCSLRRLTELHTGTELRNAPSYTDQQSDRQILDLHKPGAIAFVRRGRGTERC